MTTNSDPSSARDQLTAHHGSVVHNGDRLQSAAVRGASRAFVARGDNRQPQALHSSTNGARAAAASAGFAARQKSVSPPKASTSVFVAPPRSQSAQISQVQQLVEGFEQSSTDRDLQMPSSIRGASRRDFSRSPSQVAARIATSSSLSSPRAPLPVRNGAKDSKVAADTRVPCLNDEPENAGSVAQPKFIRSRHSPSHERPIAAPRPFGPVSSAQIFPAVLAMEQDRTNEKGLTAASLQKHQPQGASSTLAAQAAVRNLVSVNQSSVPAPSRSEFNGVFTTAGAVSEDSDRGRSSNAHRQTIEGKVNPRNVSHSSIAHEQHPASGGRDLSGERAGRSVSNPMAYPRNLSLQSRHRFPSISNAHYVDERTGLTEGSLAHAIVASSLATSRAPSPAKKVPPPPPPRRSSLSRSLFRHRHSSDTDLPRYGGTHQGMRQTLRKSPSEDSDDEHSRRKHKHFMKHPNKHREGSRKRWKDKVTERERKRYEGVWAANKGIFLTTSPSVSHEEATLETPTSVLVLDLVVRDIWGRSRLPNDALADIWDLVDRHGVGTLTRDEFVLGLWLIDQRLKGRKLPIRVSPTLWASVRQAMGMRVLRRL